MKKKSAKVTLILAILIVGLVGYYAFLSNKARSNKEGAVMTAAQNALSRDLEKDYPGTVKEVVKYYTEIEMCFYGQDCSAEEIEKLGLQARRLYDDALLANNEQETYLARLKSDIQSFRDSKRRMTSASVAASTNVVYFDKDGYECARIQCGYNIMEGNVSKFVKQEFVLRRDKERRWKIYGWKTVTDNK